MKKLFGAIAVIAALLMAGGAWAQVVEPIQSSVVDIAAVWEKPDLNMGGWWCSTIDDDVLGQPSGAFVVGSEWLAALSPTAPQYVYLGNAKPNPCAEKKDRSNILYRPACDLSYNTILEFTVKGGAIGANAKYALWDCKKGKVADLVDFRPDSSFGLGGYTKMYFEIGEDNVPAGSTLVMVSNGYYPNKDNRPVLEYSANSLASNGNALTIEVSEAQDDGGKLLVCPLTQPEKLLVVYDKPQVTAQVEFRNGYICKTEVGPATSTIDVFCDPTRSNFISEWYPKGDTGYKESAAQIHVLDAGYLGPVNEGICLTDDCVSYKLTLNGNQTAIYDVKLGKTPYVLTEAVNSWSITSNFKKADLRKCEDNTLLITVDGKTAISSARYGVTLDLTVCKAVPADQRLLDDQLAFEWLPNAVEARVAYIILDTDTGSFSSFVSIGNRSKKAAEVWVDGVATSEDGISKSVTGLPPLTIIPAEGVAVLNHAQIRTYLGLDPAKLWRADLTIYTATPKDQADISAQQKNGAGSRTILHVLYITGNPFDLKRQWQ